VPRRLHVVGASGSGTSTLAAALAAHLGLVHLDIDDFFWEPTNPPYERARERAARQQLLGAALERHPGWALSGSLCGWGDLFIPRFEVVVYLLVPTPVRMERLAARERQRYGADAVAPGGWRSEASREFLEWAARYDEGGLDLRSRARHDAWLADLPCPVVRLEGDRPVSRQVADVLAAV
jgi:adenylate kinase family enzyme